MMKIVAIWVTATVGVSVFTSAQSNEPKFDVASIKPNKSGSNRVNLNPLPGGRFTAVNVSVMDLVAVAYGSGMPFPRSNILNAPAWMSRDRFDIVAKAESNATQEEVALMLRPLLVERFRLSIHGETRERPIYTLTFARADKVLGPGLKPATRDCMGPREPNAPAPDGCEMTSVPLDASPELAQALRSIEADGPSLFTALQEQLGLKLVSGKDQTPVLVVEHVEQPSPD